MINLNVKHVSRYYNKIRKLCKDIQVVCMQFDIKYFRWIYNMYANFVQTYF